MAGVIDRFRATIRAALGLPTAPGEPPDLMRLGLYRARVDVCAANGSTVDVTPEDSRISPEKGVPVRVGIPGAAAVVSAGAVVLLGWERGDPARPYAVPSWESGATVTKLVLAATLAHLGAEAGSQFIALSNKVDNELSKLYLSMQSIIAPLGGGAVNISSPYIQASTAATKVKAV